jgi:simple sugar transport system ATP-binding protein
LSDERVIGNGGAALSRPPVAEAERISKSFGITKAVQDVSLSVAAGECHALIGRNGAGKSTLVAVLTGLLRPDEGHVRLQGEPAPGVGDRAAWQQRVACVYQRSMVIPSLTVAENVYLNRSQSRIVSWRAIRGGARRLMLEWGFDLDIDALASSLSVEQKQIVEIARALSIGARFLILDEPTASLEANAAERLFEHVRRLKATGVGVLYISHHLEEVYKICDRATVLRDGKHVVTESVDNLDEEALVAAMVGTAVEQVSTSATSSDGAHEVVRLRVSNLSVASPSGPVDDATFDVRARECVGLFGLRGSGAVTIADAVAGLLKPDAGEISVDGEPLPSGRVDAALDRGVGYVPEDRHARGFIPTLGVDENLTLPILKRLSRFGFVSIPRRGAAARELGTRLQIVASSGHQLVGELSGGNQQKVVVGRALAGKPSLLVVVGPTTGVDVASKAALLGVVEEARSEGMAVLLVSDDLDELRVCTRVLVMVRGKVTREFLEQPWDRLELIAAAEGLAA